MTSPRRAPAGRWRVDVPGRLRVSLAASLSDHPCRVELQETEEMRLKMVSELRERGNVAMRRQDLQAARSFYTEALDIPHVPPDERAKLLGNRAACYVALSRADLALEDAEEAAELLPDSGKALYRLGCLQDEHADLASAAASLSRAAALLPAAAEIHARLAAVQAKLAAMGSAAANAEGWVARAEARAVEAEARAAAAAVVAAAASRALARAEGRLRRAASNPAWREAAVACQELVDERESAAEGSNSAAARAKSEASAARQAAQSAASFEARKARATSCFAAGQLAEAREEFSGLVKSARTTLTTDDPTAAPPTAKAFAKAVLGSALSNRAACSLRLGDFGPCIRDCDAALEAGAQDGAVVSSPELTDADVPPSPAKFKILMRRAEANWRFGQVDEAASDVAALRSLAASDAERAAVEYLAQQVEG